MSVGDEEEALRFGADHYLKKLLDRKTTIDQFWTGIKVAIIALSLVSNRV